MDHNSRQALHTNARVFSLGLFAASLPFGVLLFNNIAICLMILNWLLESSLTAKWQMLKQNAMAWLFIQLFLLYTIGLLYSDNLHQGFFEIEKKLSVLSFPLVLATTLPLSKKQAGSIFKAFIIACTAATLFCFAYATWLNYREGQTLSYVYNAVFFDRHLPGRYAYFNYWYFTYELFAKPLNMHPVYFAMYLVLSCCLSVWLWWDWALGNKKRNRLVLLFLLYNFITVVLLASRTQLAILLMLGTAFILHQAYISKKMLIGIISMLGVYGLLLGFILLNPVTRERFINSNKPGAHFSDNKYGEGGLSLRRYKWKYTAETIAHHPLTGTGTGDAQDELQKTYSDNDFKIGYDLRFNAHNQFLQTTLELGIIGLLSLIACLALPGCLAFKQKELLYLIFIAVFVISCLTESMLEVNKGIVFYTFFNAVFAFHFLKRKPAVGP